MHVAWLILAIVATVAYHVVLKLTPAAVNPYLSLAVTYAGVTALFAAIYATTQSGPPLRAALGLLNWTALGLAIAIVLLDLAFLMLYRSGFAVSVGQLVTQSAAALLLLLAGVVFFKENLSILNAGGILLCIVGLWLINYRG